MYLAVMQNVLNMLSLKITACFLFILLISTLKLSSVLSVTGRFVQITIYIVQGFIFTFV